jgi:hypothetical protein
MIMTMIMIMIMIAGTHLPTTDPCRDLWWVVVAVDRAHWGSLANYTSVQHVCETEYISYDATVAGSRPSLAPHVDNGAKVTIVALLHDEASFDGGVNFFGGAVCGGARSHRMRRCARPTPAPTASGQPGRCLLSAT